MSLSEVISLVTAVIAIGIAAHTQGKLDMLLKILEDDDTNF